MDREESPFEPSSKKLEKDELNVMAMDSLSTMDEFVAYLEKFHTRESHDFIGNGFDWLRIHSQIPVDLILRHLEYDAKFLLETFSNDKNQLKLKYMCKIIAKWYYNSALYTEALVYYTRLMNLSNIKSSNESKLEFIEDKLDYIRCLIETNSTDYTSQLKLDVKNMFEDLKSDLELTNTKDIAMIVIKSAHCLLHGMLQNFDTWEEGKHDEYFTATNAYIIKLKCSLGVQNHDIWPNYLLEGHRLLKRKEYSSGTDYLTGKAFSLNNHPVSKVMGNHAGIQDFCNLVAMIITFYLSYSAPDNRFLCYYYLETLKEFLSIQKLAVHDRLTLNVNSAILNIAKSLDSEDDINNYETLFKYTDLSPFITCFETIEFLSEFGQIGLMTFGANHTSHKCFKVAVTTFETFGKGKSKSIHCLYLSSYLFTTYQLQTPKMDEMIANLVEKILQIASETEGCERYAALAKAILASVKVTYYNPGNRMLEKQSLLEAIKTIYESLKLYNKVNTQDSLEEGKDQTKYAKFQKSIRIHLILAKVFDRGKDLHSTRKSLLKHGMLNRMFGLTEDIDESITSGEKLMNLTEFT